MLRGCRLEIEWEQLAHNVWLLRGIPEGGVFGLTRTEFTVVVVADGATARLLAGERINTIRKARALRKSLEDHGFTRASAQRYNRTRLYNWRATCRT